MYSLSICGVWKVRSVDPVQLQLGLPSLKGGSPENAGIGSHAVLLSNNGVHHWNGIENPALVV